MKKALFLALLLCSSLAFAQQYPSGEGGTVATSVSTGAFPLLAPAADNCAAIPYSFTGDSDSGMCQAFAGYLSLYSENNEVLRLRGGPATKQALFTLTGATSQGNFTVTAQGATSGNANITTSHTGTANKAEIVLGTQSSANTMEFRASQGGTNPTGVYIQAQSPAQARFDVNGSGRFGAYDTYVYSIVAHRFAQGSQAAKALTFNADTSDGIWFPGLNQATFGTFESTGSYTAEVRARSDASTAILELRSEDGGNSNQLKLYSDRTESNTEILAPNGLTSAPAYSFTNDTDMGLWNTGSSTVRLQASDNAGGVFANLTMDATSGTGTPVATLSTADASDTASVQCQAWSPVCTISLSDGTDSSSTTFYDNKTEFSDVVLGPSGAVGAPTFGFTGATTTGAYYTGSAYGIAVAGTLEASISGTQFAVESGGTGALPSITRISDTNTGFFWPDATGDEFGISVGGYAKWQARHTAKDLTESSATNVVRFTIQNPNALGATVNWTVYAKDASDQQSRRGSTYLAAVNKAGTITCNVSDVGTTVLAESAGGSTLGVTTSCVTGTNEVFFAINAVSSLTQTTLAVRWTAEVDGETSVTHEQ